MTKLNSIVLNTLNNDSRVKKIAETLSNYFDVSFTALTYNYINKFFIKDSMNDFNIFRIKYAVKGFKKKYVGSRSSENKTSLNPFLIIRDISWQIRLNYILFKTLIYEHSDIYYCNDFNTLIAGYLASRRKRAKLVYDSHELWAERINSRKNLYMKTKRILEYFIEWFLIKRCDLVITVSEGIADELIKRYHIRRPLVIRNLDTVKQLPSKRKRVEIRESLGIPQDAVLIVYQGGLSESRGIPELIEAFNLLPDNYHLLLMGRRLNESMLDKIKSNEQIHFPGMIPQDVLFNYTSVCDIGIAPIKQENSKSYSLAFPNKFSQYMNAGLALLLYKVVSSENIINKCNCGNLLDKITPEEISKMILNMDNNDIQSMKKKSRKCFLRYYNWEIDKTKLIKELVNLT